MFTMAVAQGGIARAPRRRAPPYVECRTGARTMMYGRAMQSPGASPPIPRPAS